MTILAYIFGAVALLASAWLGIRTYRLQLKVRRDIRKFKAKGVLSQNKKETVGEEIFAEIIAPSNHLQVLINTSNGISVGSIGTGMTPTAAPNNFQINNSYGH